MSTAGLDINILGPAFLAGLLVISTHVPLGRQVLKRGIIFIDLAVAQIAGVGVIAAHSFGWAHSPVTVQLVAFTTALTGALTLYFVERRWPDIQEALIGTSFVLSATAGIIILAHHPHAGEYLKELLAGQILWVDTSQLWIIGTLYAVVLILWFGFRGHAKPLLFYLLFAATVTASVQLVGVYLVFASLIIPALVVRNINSPWGLAIAYGVGTAGYGSGLAASAIFDLPAGAVIVWTLALTGSLAAIVIAKLNKNPLPHDE